MIAYIQKLNVKRLDLYVLDKFHKQCGMKEKQFVKEYVHSCKLQKPPKQFCILVWIQIDI